jgi:hypothetical protein
MKWINVKDKLPEKNKVVLAYGKTTYADNNDFEVRECWVKVDVTPPLWRYDIGCCGDEYYLENVTHWMPFPEKPNESNTATNYSICLVCYLPIDPKRGHPSYCGK